MTVVDLPSPGRGTEYMLGLKNFYVLTRYNRSFFYALAVYQLGQRVKAQMEASDAANAEQQCGFVGERGFAISCGECRAAALHGSKRYKRSKRRSYDRRFFIG